MYAKCDHKFYDITFTPKNSGFTLAPYGVLQFSKTMMEDFVCSANVFYYHMNVIKFLSYQITHGQDLYNIWIWYHKCFSAQNS